MALWAIRNPASGRHGWLRETGTDGRVLGFGYEEDAHRLLSHLIHRGYPLASRLIVAQYPGRPSGEVNLIKSPQVKAVAEHLLGSSQPSMEGC